MATTIQIKGLRELGAAMAELKKEVAQRVAGSMTNAAAQVIKKAAVQNVVRNPSIETGSLKQSIIVKKIPRGQSALTSEHIVTVRGRGKIIRKGKKKGQRQTEAPHAHFIEFGTVNMPAEPFMRPAFDHMKERAVEEMKKRGWARIDDIAQEGQQGA